MFSLPNKNISSVKKGGQEHKLGRGCVEWCFRMRFFSFCWHFIPIGEFLLKLICNLHLDLIIFLSNSHSVAGQLRLTSLFAACLTFQLLNLAIHLNSVESMEQMRFFFSLSTKVKHKWFLLTLCFRYECGRVVFLCCGSTLTYNNEFISQESKERRKKNVKTHPGTSKATQ